MEADDEQNSNGPQAINVRPVTGLRTSGRHYEGSPPPGCDHNPGLPYRKCSRKNVGRLRENPPAVT
jgi:hypothetical protein